MLGQYICYNLCVWVSAYFPDHPSTAVIPAVPPSHLRQLIPPTSKPSLSPITSHPGPAATRFNAGLRDNTVVCDGDAFSIRRGDNDVGGVVH